MPTIRVATPDDEDAAQAVSEAAFAELRLIYRPTDKARAHKAGLQPKLTRLVAVDEGGSVVGTVKFYREDDSLRLIGLAVANDCRRRGVGRQLVEHVAERARAAGCGTLKLYAVRETGNVLVYEQLGFRVLSESIDGFVESPTGTPLAEAFMSRNVTA